MKSKKSRKPFIVEPVIAADLLGVRAAGRAEALERARRTADRHRLTVAVWRELPDAAGGTRRIDLVQLVHPRPRKRRPARNGDGRGRQPPPAA